MGDSIDDIMFVHRKKKLKNFGEDLKKDIEFKYRKEEEAKMKAVTPEMEKKFIENMKNGMNLGNAAKDAGIEDTMTAAKIFNKRIKAYHYIDWDN